MNKAKVGIVMGSDSDLPVMQEAALFLTQMHVDFELTIVSAHRTPDRMFEYASKAYENGLRVIIAGAGGAAHLPGMLAAITALPVIGVPIKSSNSVDGWDSLLSILQMPSGIPVATVALNGAKNAGILATEILAVSDEKLYAKMLDFKNVLKNEVETKVKALEKAGFEAYLKTRNK